jgi:hypothetical protein
MTKSPFFFSENNKELHVFINTKDLLYMEMIQGIIKYMIKNDEGKVN